MKTWIVCFTLALVLPRVFAAEETPGASPQAGGVGKPAAPVRPPPDVPPALGCWFWSEAEFKPEGYRPFLDLVGRHAAFNRLTTSLRVARHEVTDPAVHDQIARAAGYARQYEVKLVMDLDVRLAREAFRRVYPDELQEMLRWREVELTATGEVVGAIAGEVLSDHYTFAATPYVPVASRLVRVYAGRVGANGLESDSLADITARCRVVSATTNELRVAIPSDETTRGGRALVAAAFAHLTPDVFAPHLIEFQRQILRQYADVPLGGACKDEWGFPPCFDGCPAKNDFWFSPAHAAAYARRTGGRDLVRDSLLMWRGERGRERERQSAINHYQQLAWERNAALETDFYHAVKEVFGSEALVATHATWWPNPDTREFKKNGLDWWAAPRDLAQTDEVTPFAVRTALAKKWGGGLWVNMFYSSSVADYEQALWSSALTGGRINFHPLYPTANALGLENTADLLRGELMQADARVRLLNFITPAPLDCPVAVLFGHAGAMNWAGPHYNDVGLALTDALARQGFPADLIPTTDLQSGALRLDADGSLTYGPQRYAVGVLYHPEFEPAETASFLDRAARGPTALWRVGDWTHDFEARPITPNWPSAVRRAEDPVACAEQIIAYLRARGVAPQTPATESIGWDVKTAAPPRAGSCRWVDGTAVWLAGQRRVTGDPIEVRQAVAGQPIEARSVGVLAVRFDLSGRLAALAAGGLSRFRGGGLELQLEPPLDLAVWREGNGPWRGVLQNAGPAIPVALTRLTTNWMFLASPTPVPPR